MNKGGVFKRLILKMYSEVYKKRLHDHIITVSSTDHTDMACRVMSCRDVVLSRYVMLCHVMS